MLRAVEKGTHARHAAIVVGGQVMGCSNVDEKAMSGWLQRWQPPQLQPKRLSRDHLDMLFPLRMPLQAGGMAGWLLVGPRPDGSLPSADGPWALLKIAKPVARSIASTRTREARAAEHRRTLALLHGAVADLAMRLQRLERSNACADASGAPWPRPAA